MADLATLQTRLTEAESAYHKLMTGSKTVEVQHGDMRTKYTEAQAGTLLAYIADLRAQIAALGGGVTGLRRRAFSVDLPSY
ncbi:MAG: hypothetical protein JNM76_14640 [Betaproteobacteria bacterium]|nr:hypothetical protein [Betaproteobacteria bacterium]